MPETHAQIRRWHLYPTAEDLVAHAAAAIGRIAAEAIARRGDFHFVLAGGSTPIAIYARLRDLDCDWSAWHIYIGDERCVGPEHPERNSRMAEEAWLRHVPIPAGQIHPIRGELGPARAAADYAALLASVPRFDLVTLGLGEDGHTASLFPDHPWGVEADAPATLAVTDSPKPPPERVSLSARALSQAPQVFFYVAGAAKRDAVARWRRGEGIPAGAIRPANGVDIWVDEAAWG
ncbi:MAG: 6-phosphogluconolactonase [Pseudomonadota bacterium]|uniref:6-phosphogluconolactonase n=1 Tax=Thermithiobacillus tepidarius TaxID=929 RepID=UPI000414FB5F|nr:6-phosphogluconolactonase [Thermithiobacillus tepidarius]